MPPFEQVFEERKFTTYHAQNVKKEISSENFIFKYIAKILMLAYIY